MRGGRGPWWIDTLPEAVDFIRDAFGIPNMLDDEASRTYRQLWRGVFLPKSLRANHCCRGCRGGRKQRFDWDALCLSPLVQCRAIQLSEVAPLLQKHTSRDNPVTVALFFERCDLPVFVLPIEAAMRPLENMVDLYIAPLKKPTWTLVYTHEDSPLYAERLPDTAQRRGR